MPTLHAGRKKSGEYRIVDLTNNQMQALGFVAGHKPIKIGCGSYACGYLPSPESDAVVKITTDRRDALVAYMIKNLPEQPIWAIPVYAVWKLKGDTFALCTARAEKLPEEWADPIDAMYKFTAQVELQEDEWSIFHGRLTERIDQVERDAKAKLIQDEESRLAADKCKRMRHALSLLNEAVISCAKYNIDFSDCHSLNFGWYQGRPVILDFGLSQSELTHLAAENRPEYPELKSLPVLPF